MNKNTKALFKEFCCWVKICLWDRLFNISARGSRREYWSFFIFTHLALTTVMVLTPALLSLLQLQYPGLVFSLVLMSTFLLLSVPSFTVFLRRYIDAGRTRKQAILETVLFSLGLMMLNRQPPLLIWVVLPLTVAVGVRIVYVLIQKSVEAE